MQSLRHCAAVMFPACGWANCVYAQLAVVSFHRLLRTERTQLTICALLTAPE